MKTIAKTIEELLNKENVEKVNNVIIINDSKTTNTKTEIALNNIAKTYTLKFGGRRTNITYTELEDKVVFKFKETEEPILEVNNNEFYNEEKMINKILKEASESIVPEKIKSGVMNLGNIDWSVHYDI